MFKICFNELSISFRIISYGNNFDFMFVFKNDIQMTKNGFLEILNKLKGVIGRKNKVKYGCIEKNVEFCE